MKSKNAGSYFFAGLSVSEGKKGLAVNTVLPRSPAKKAGLVSGDVIVAVDEQKVSLRDFMASLKTSNTIQFVRKTKPQTTKMRCVDLRRSLSPLGDMLREEPVNDRKCDEKCNCTVPIKNGRCGTAFIPIGNGFNGGFLFEKVCTVVSIEGGKFGGGFTSCGPREFF